jgi:hypothetical protein
VLVCELVDVYPETRRDSDRVEVVVSKLVEVMTNRSRASSFSLEPRVSRVIHVGHVPNSTVLRTP